MRYLAKGKGEQEKEKKTRWRMPCGAGRPDDGGEKELVTALVGQLGGRGEGGCAARLRGAATNKCA